MKLLSAIKIGNERYPALTGIRALGAMAVFFNHLPFNTGFTFYADVLTFFFVLSGFLIFYLYYDKAGSSANRGISPKGGLYNYFINRFARIYPVYFLLVSIAIYLNHNYNAGLLIKNYTLTHALFNDKDARVIEQSGSLTIEECFYLFAPLFMFLLRRYNFGISLLSGFLLLGLALIISLLNLPYLFLQSPEFIFSTTFFGHFFEFFTGAWVALIILKNEKNGNIIVKGYKRTSIGCAGSIILVCLPGVLYHTNVAYQREIYILVNNFILPVFISWWYWGLITEKTILSKLLSVRLLGWLGRTSYAFYLVHIFVIYQLAVPYIRPWLGDHHNLYVVAVFVLAQLVALIIFIFYEEPVNRWIRRKFIHGKTMSQLPVPPQKK